MFPSVKSWGFFIYLHSSYWCAIPLVLLGWLFCLIYTYIGNKVRDIYLKICDKVSSITTYKSKIVN